MGASARSQALPHTSVFAARRPKGFRCLHRGYHKRCPLRQRNVFQCIRYKHQASLIADIVFDNTKLPLTTWFLAIYVLTQSKNGISAMDLKRQLGVSYNTTAWMLKHKLMQTMRERDDSQPLRDIVELDDAYLGGGPAGAWCRPQGALRGGGASQHLGASRAAAAEPGDGLPQAGAASLDPAALASGNAGALGRSGLFPGRAVGWLRTPSAGHRRRQG